MREEMVRVKTGRTAAELKVGETGKIVAIDTADRLKLRKLLALGIFPGTDVRLVQNFPAYVLQAGFTQIAVDESMAKAMRVE